LCSEADADARAQSFYDPDDFYNKKTPEDTERTHKEGDELYSQGLYHRTVEYYKIVMRDTLKDRMTPALDFKLNQGIGVCYT
jgi:hypothetical protein